MFKRDNVEDPGMRHFKSNPFDEETDSKLSFDDVTLLAFMAAAALVLGYVFLLGMFCATHRIEAAVLMM